MALYRFLFAPVLLAVAVLHGGGRPHQAMEPRADAVVQVIDATSPRAARPVPAAARADAATRRPEPLRSPASR
ncbi:hypothetical protein [Anaeromyxobacter oryzae]|uniref:Uncharacterized protein n=1 Tax=Anaeromyxobacter oryzae TaxID=2918170 RepID=A0ABN6MYV3_9BACT|nr:hypothetical protein [Anaeromyxobacter oryzae]BDG06147.1 hypothetical protein AMOR_51430 [Anaeromyxobacter oryzae]